MKREIEKNAALSIILGFLAALTGIFLIGFILGIAGIAFGYISIKKYGKHPIPIIGIALSIVGILLALTMLASSGEDFQNQNTDVIATVNDQSQKDTGTVTTIDDTRNDTSVDTQGTDDNIPTEYKSALIRAENYSNVMYMSKSGIYDQLISEYGDKFSEEAAQYAVENLDADYSANALIRAENYSDTMYMSKSAIYDQLISEYGDKFTKEEAQYAVDNMIADWNENALKTAINYQTTMNMSPNAIYDQLISEYGAKFTKEEAQYAIDNLE